MKILIAAGGSGGHLLPAQQLGKQLQLNEEVLFAGYMLDQSPFFDRKTFRYQTIIAAPLRFSFFGMIRFFSSSWRGIIQSIRLIRKFQPDVVVGFGSYHVFPILCATMILRRKLVLFEANCLLGKVNRLFARSAKIVATQFQLKKDRSNAQMVPLLPWTMPSQVMEKKQARTVLGLSNDKETFLVFGGSQGASFLNRMIPLVLPKNAQVIHLTGNEKATQEVALRYQEMGIVAVVKSYDSNMPMLYAASDYAICRSGAGTIAELIQHSLPALLIPFPFSADDHQSKNAEFLVKNVRGAMMLFEHQASIDVLVSSIEQLRNDAAFIRHALSDFRRECKDRKSFREQIINLGKSV